MKTGVDFTPNAVPPETTTTQQFQESDRAGSRCEFLKLAPQWIRHPPFLIAFVVLALAVSAAIVFKNNFWHSPAVAAGEPPPVVTVSVAPAMLNAVDHALEVTGSVSAWDPLAIGSEVNGLRIDTVNVEEGDHVGQGQALATLNSSVLRAQLDQAKARLASSQTNLKKAIQPNRFEDIESLKAALSQAKANTAQQEAMLAQAEANLANAERNERRFGDLVKQGAVSQADFETRQTTAKTALAEVNHMKESIRAANFAWQQANERLSMALTGGRKEDIEISRASVAENQATVKQLEAQVEQTIIRAPTDALVIKRDAHIGDITSAGKPLFTLMRNNRLELRAQVPEADLPKISCNQQVKLLSNAYSSLPVTGRVREISPTVDAESRLGLVRIDVPSDSHVKPGMFLRGLVDLGRRQALTVPSKAVFSRDGQSFVFTLVEKQARRRLVQTGTIKEGGVEIVSGLKPGETVITDGGGFLKDGDYVRVSR